MIGSEIIIGATLGTEKMLARFRQPPITVAIIDINNTIKKFFIFWYISFFEYYFILRKN